MHAATTARFHFANPSSAQPLHFSYPPDRRAAPPSSSASASASSSSFVRAAAPRQMQPFAASASHFLPSAFRSTYPLTSSSAGSASFGVGPSPMGSPYEVDVAEADLRTSTQPYSPEQYPSQPWSTVGEPSQAQAQSQYADPYASPPYELPPAASASPSENGAYASVKAEEPLESYAAGMYLAPYADHLVSANHPSQQQQQQQQHQQSPSFAYSLPQFHPSSSPQHQHQMAYAYNHSHGHGHGHPSQGGSAQVAASYMLAAAAAASPGAGAHLQYPDYTPEGEAPRYVHPAQVSPAISPSSPFAQLQDASASPQMAPMSQNQSQGLDPRFTMNNALQAMGAVGVMGAGMGAGMGIGAGGLNGGGPSPSEDFEFDSAGSGSVSGGESPYLAGASAPIPVPQPGGAGAGRSTQRKRPRSVSFTSSSEEDDEDDFSNSGSGSGESEHDHDEDDDGEFVQGSSGSRAVRARRYDAEYAGSPGTSTSLGSASASVSAGSRRLAPPVPVPNLTKKSRGRRVPTAQQVVSEGTMQKRGYMCKVAGCGKCFARGEHLKRHVRSIHTNEKREWFALRFVFLVGCCVD